MEHTNPTCRAEWILAALMRLEGPLTRYSLRLTGNVEQARDVVQEAFLRLCREDPAELDGRLDQWLFTVCRNQALDVRRKEQRMTTAAFERVEASSGREIEPAHAAEQSDDASLVAALVGQLPVNQQEVVRLKFQNSLSSTFAIFDGVFFRSKLLKQRKPPCESQGQRDGADQFASLLG